MAARSQLLHMAVIHIVSAHPWAVQQQIGQQWVACSRLTDSILLLAAQTRQKLKLLHMLQVRPSRQLVVVAECYLSVYSLPYMAADEVMPASHLQANKSAWQCVLQVLERRQQVLSRILLRRHL